MSDTMPVPTWTATFPQGSVVSVYDDWFDVTGPVPEKDEVIGMMIAHLTEVPWPSIAGFDLDTTPGWNPDLMYQRLASIGAVNVTGPQGPSEPPVDDPYTIVG